MHYIIFTDEFEDEILVIWERPDIEEVFEREYIKLQKKFRDDEIDVEFYDKLHDILEGENITIIHDPDYMYHNTLDFDKYENEKDREWN